MLRDYEKLERLGTDCGNTLVIGNPAAKDVTHDFFLQCYSFKDWLKKDSRVKNPKDVEDYIDSSPALSVAADLCNSFKHAGLDKGKPRSGQLLERINTAYSLVAKTHGGPLVASTRIVITMGTENHDALDLATGCIQDWDTFLVSQNIVFAKNKT